MLQRCGTLKLQCGLTALTRKNDNKEPQFTVENVNLRVKGESRARTVLKAHQLLMGAHERTQQLVCECVCVKVTSGRNTLNGGCQNKHTNKHTKQRHHLCCSGKVALMYCNTSRKIKC